MSNADALGTKVTLDFPNHKAVEGKITQTTESSLYATFVHPNGETIKSRFTKRVDGEWRRAGTGKYAPALKFLP